jgi:hypothetical protein
MRLSCQVMITALPRKCNVPNTPEPRRSNTGQPSFSPIFDKICRMFGQAANRHHTTAAANHTQAGTNTRTTGYPAANRPR